MRNWLQGAQSRAWRLGLLFAIALVAAGSGYDGRAGYAAMPLSRDHELRSRYMAPVPRFVQTSTPTEIIAPTPTPALSATESEEGRETVPYLGTLVYCSRLEGFDHLVALSASSQEPRLVASGPWHDRDPAVSPDGTKIAFSSHRDGNWELYVLDVLNGTLRRLTDTIGFEGAPTWSPDGLWIAYEAYYGSNFDIWILALDAAVPPIQLTSDPASDTSPSWDPARRRIAFISDRDGEPDVFLAQLDRAEERYVNLTPDSHSPERDPAFSPDGSMLAYVRQQDELDLIILAPADNLEDPGLALGQGTDPTWISGGSVLLSILNAAYGNYLMLYPVGGSIPPIAGLPQPERISGLAWSERDMVGEMAAPDLLLELAEEQEDQSEGGAPAHGSVPLTTLPGIDAPIAKLSDEVANAFLELRERVILEAGWDFLGTLDNAFVGVNDPMPPGFALADWLYTGRAFAINSSALHARWVEIVREDYGGITYWRVYLRALEQDGTLGEPMRELPWDLEARYGSNPAEYDAGGRPRLEIPAGYYVDFTELAADFGFERLPSLRNWRTFFPGARYGEFVRMDGRTWEEAMLEIYPPSAFETPTPYRTPIPGG